MATKAPEGEPRRNRMLGAARNAKQDEFYTQLVDIENELRHYRTQLRGKIVLCNCDDPYESNFFRYFALNFNALGLKKLIATSYAKSTIAGGYLPLVDMAGLKPDGKEPYAIEISEVPDANNDGAIDLADVEWLLRNDTNTCRTLKGDSEYGPGDFRSGECVEYLKQADVVVTNPPFSLFREFVALLMAYEKKFVVLGNVNAATYKETFDLIKRNLVWFGPSIKSGDREFRVPAHYPLEAAGFRVDEGGVKYIRVKGVRWFTNLDHKSRHEPIPLFRRYDPEEYPSYDNYTAIEVGKTADIPMDYENAMGVPITFLDRYSPDQFEIIGITDRDNNSGLKTREYTDKDAPNPGDLNRRGAILTNAGLVSTYARLLIKRRLSA
ncbi:adenine-specific methyltransferase EcoRI family protein [Novosphingobium sp.]|uniref:adenine-specific methyltransferase EcoRI family protein n=1 Tax=Novosphingobium sp. TaxID=1874826 RepID=UPI0025F21296|nr:adenine-specific methyltransferase EcoRI family protein [Novosphingobium sp.]